MRKISLFAPGPFGDEIQFDEKWDYVYKKEKHCDENNPADARRLSSVKMVRTTVLFCWRCSRKVRKSYCFSKDWDVHRAATCLTMYSYNFCWAVRTLRRPDGRRGDCTPAMSAGLTDHVWTIREWLTFPARQ